ncbi:hypothetical protein SAMN06265222_107247 [Neorhodopirellula lusitana]|uniref:Response regulatory domain-containing protein n=1 Tax=Neorhodopirellula lusitana TaxID=445327 RepID=A0ABY1QAD9_9BACT|nr:hypothetical protein [Neorhodopirellula lusitana]SMP62149.1 hypothetical protein SAMN06265222_107247 [Neorhodopirellula lusitana]
MKPNVTSNQVFKNNATVVVADSKPLSLLATAGVLHQAGMQCVCARTPEAVRKAFGISESDGDSNADIQKLADDLIDMVDEAEGTAIRLDEPAQGVPAQTGGAPTGLPHTEQIDLIVWDVGDQPMDVLQTLELVRQSHPEVPAILIADAKWAGLEKKVEEASASTPCLFKPIDPSALLAVAEPLLWMPALQTSHRKRGSRPNRPGWVTL